MIILKSFLSSFIIPVPSYNIKLTMNKIIILVVSIALIVLQQQAVCGGSREDAPAARFGGECVEIEIVIEPEQRKLEPVLPARLAVTGAGVATLARENRLDILLEGDRQLAACAGLYAGWL